MSNDSFSPPPFKPEQSLVLLQRSLRELRTLTARGQGFDLKAMPAVGLTHDDDAVCAQLARRPSRSPEWDQFRLSSAADVRRFVDEVKKRLARWERDD